VDASLGEITPDHPDTPAPRPAPVAWAPPDQPAVDSPTVRMPASEHPTVQVPGPTASPVTAAPTTAAPVTAAPTTAAPAPTGAATAAPTTAAPAPTGAATAAPTTTAPAPFSLAGFQVAAPATSTTSRWRPRRSGPWWVAAAAAVVIVGLVIGLLVWSPWSPPATPKDVVAHGTSATAVTLAWSARSEGTPVETYLIQRDGKEAGSVPGSQVTFRDEGLVPGSKHTYAVVAARGSKHSTASAPVPVTVPAPSPTALVQQGADPQSVTLGWSPPADSPPPDQYLLLVDGRTTDVVGAPAAGQPTQRLLGLQAGSTYSVQVSAVWSGGGISAPSDALAATTADPPISEARLEASSGVDVAFRVTSSNSTDLTVGKSFTSSWTLTPTCGSGPCNVTLEGDFHPSGDGTPFTLTLVRNGATYTGTTRASISSCRGRSVEDTVTVTLTVATATRPDWIATRWTGSIQYVNPYTNAGGGYYCPSGKTVAVISASSPTT